MPEEGLQVVGSRLGMSGNRGGVSRDSRRSTVFAAQLVHASASVLAFPGGILDSRAHGVHIFGQSGGVTPCRFLGFEVPDAVRLRVPDASPLHGSFPADELLACRFDLVETSAFCGFAAEGDLLRDLGELLFEGASESVGPFARPVRLATAKDEAEALGRGVSKRGILAQEYWPRSTSSPR
ncbi:hypothetical protein ACH4S8_43490 [Streptomyces sp. NPDC021080]|uniref:hypothetical protein n=1 Tax=Streptomyces sp. NPDC021080 TaxID=3365110 RepID=UPI0037A4EE8B